MSAPTRILLVEDDPQLARELAALMTRERWGMDVVGSLGSAFECLLANGYRAVILDRRLPDGDGLSLLPVLRARSPETPVICLTARDAISDRIEGLDAGADDYLVKPFAPGELMARLRAACRRRTGVNAVPIPPVRLGRIEYDFSQRQAFIDGKALDIPRRELDLLELLVGRAGRVVQRTFLAEQIYGVCEVVTPNALETHASRLRRRLDHLDAGVEIKSVRGLGYMIRAS